VVTAIATSATNQCVEDRPGIVATSGAALMHGFDLAFYVLAAIPAVAAVLTALTIGSSRFQRTSGAAGPAGRTGTRPDKPDPRAPGRLSVAAPTPTVDRGLPLSAQRREQGKGVSRPATAGTTTRKFGCSWGGVRLCRAV
jgi:hypothetical protein